LLFSILVGELPVGGGQNISTSLNNGPSGSGTSSGSILIGPNVNVSNECGLQSETFISIPQKEHECDGTNPCNAIDYGNQYGDYSGLASHGGLSFPILTDSRRNQNALGACRTGRVMEEVFTPVVK